MSDDLADVAERAVRAGADYLRERFDAGTIEAEYTALDVTTRADRTAERRVLGVVREAYPDHRVTAEESGDHPGDGDYRWWVDALDGTNNFAAGIPTFGVAATACDDDGPAATAVAVPVLQDVYVASRDGGVRYNGIPVAASDGPTLAPETATVATIIGHPVVSGGVEWREWETIRTSVEAVPKRTIRSWAPVVHWGLLARGKLEGFVCYHPARREQAAGALLAREAGCRERAAGPLSVFARDEPTLDALWDAANESR